MIRMMSVTVLAMTLLWLLGGCERNANTSEKDGSAAQAVAESGHDPHEGHAHATDDGHNHAEDEQDAHAGHDHGDEHAHGGERHDLGSHEAGGLTVKVVQFGAVRADATELVFEIEVDGPAQPSAVRLLVRNADGAESLKVKANKVGDHTYDAHVGELPGVLGDDSVLVIEIETSTGKESVIFPLKT